RKPAVSSCLLHFSGTNRCRFNHHFHFLQPRKVRQRCNDNSTTRRLTTFPTNLKVCESAQTGLDRFLTFGPCRLDSEQLATLSTPSGTCHPTALAGRTLRASAPKVQSL